MVQEVPKVQNQVPVHLEINLITTMPQFAGCSEELTEIKYWAENFSNLTH